ncbi:MAG: hypothetical protein AB1631_10620 [Acidobacteriota bacterium]
MKGSKMIATLLMFALWTGGASVHATTQNAKASAKSILQAAIDAIGGEAALRSIKSVEMEGIGHENMLEQSERPAGPWLVNYMEIAELRDIAGNRLRRATKSKNFQTPEWSSLNLVVARGVAAVERGGRFFPFLHREAQEAEERIALAPERALLLALAASDLRREADTVIQNVPHHTLAFTWQQKPVRLLLNANTALPTAVEVTSSHPFDMFWGVWGDVTKRVYYSLWSMEAGGIRYPRQWDEERAQMPYRSFTVTRLKLNAPISDEAFAIPDNVKEAFEKSRMAIEDLPLGWRARGEAREIAKDIVKIPAGWDTAIVRQPDGLVIIEAPISSGYSAKVIAEAQRRYPGVAIKAVITTSDAWPHLAGIREYVARGIMIYALDLNKAILERVIQSPRKNNPDAFERNPRKPRFHIVAGKTLIGAGANRLELYPVRSETGERMIMVYMPEHKILYASDLLQKMPDGSFFWPQYLAEAAEAVSREKLAVETVFAMHLGPTPWDEVMAALAKKKEERH